MKEKYVNASCEVYRVQYKHAPTSNRQMVDYIQSVLDQNQTVIYIKHFTHKLYVSLLTLTL